jgi:hypothetical protein
MERPAHFVLIDWSEGRITAIRDFLFAPYVLEALDWVRLGSFETPDPCAWARARYLCKVVSWLGVDRRSMRN